MAPLKQVPLSYSSRKLRSRPGKEVDKVLDKENSRSNSLPPRARKNVSSKEESILKTPTKRSNALTPTKAALSPVVLLSRTPTKARAASPLKSASKALFSPSKSSPVRQSPRKILSELNNSVTSENGSAKKQLFRKDSSRFVRAKQSLSTAVPDVLVGREKELTVMRDFLSNAWTKGKKKKALYVSGAPGTGKTACLKHLLREDDIKARVIFINCMSLTTSKEIFGKIAIELDPKYDGCQAQKYVEAKICSKGAKNTLLILDEIDQLDSKSQEILYTIFEWPHLKGSKLALVGIANALDLTDRILPRLKLTASISPLQLSYPAYTRQEIIDIITSRLKDSVNPDTQEPIVKPVAIKFLAAKIASISGDIRKALDVCRRAIELAEIEFRKQTLLKPAGTTGGSMSDQIDLPQILKIFNQVYSSRVTASLKDANSDLPLQQKILMASLLLMCNYDKRKCKEVSLGKLQETYSKVCKKRNMASVDLSEVSSLCSLLESRGFFNVKQKAKNVRESKVCLRIDEKEVAAALQDKVLLTDIISDTACIA